MKKIYLAAALSALMLAGCVGGKQTGTVPAVLDTVTDSLAINDTIGRFKLIVEFPVNTSLAVSKAIGEYISETLGGEYTGDCTDAKTVAKYYFDKSMEQYRLDYKEYESGSLMRYHDSTSFSVYSENANYITYLYEKDVYQGGAHGGRLRYGTTFRKSDGRRIGWDVFRISYNEDVQNSMREGLKKYWNIDSDDLLKSYLMNENDYYLLPLPQCSPLFTENGVEFVYNQYEIAPYAAGLPVFTVPYSAISSNMKYVAKSLAGIQ